MGWFYTEKEMYDVAVCCYELSTYYDSKSKYVKSELQYIAEKTGKTYNTPSLDEIKKYAAEYNFPIEPSEEIVALLKSLTSDASTAWIKSHDEKDMQILNYFSSLKDALLNDEVYGMPRLMRWKDRFKK